MSRDIAVRVTPKAARARIIQTDGVWHVHVTVPPADGKATEAARRMLAKELGVAPTRLQLLRGARSRDKTYRLV